MLIRSFPREEKEKIYNAYDVNDHIQKYVQEMRKGNIRVAFCVNNDQSIRYEAFNDTFYSCVEITPRKEVVFKGQNPNLQKAYDSQYALLYYLLEQDEKATEEELSSRYGPHYPSLKRLSDLKGDDLKKYLNAKKAIADLAEELRAKKVAAKVQTPKFESTSPRISVSIEREDSYFRLGLSVIGRRTHKIAKIQTFLKKVNENALVNDGPASYLNFNIENWSPLDQKIIFFLSGLLNRINGAYYYTEPDDLGDADFLHLISLLLGETITFNGMPYLIGEEIREISVSLDDNGAIIQEGVRGRSIASDGLLTLTSYPKTRNLFLYRYKNAQEKALSEFLEQNPNLPFDLLQEEISTEILPALQHEVSVSSEFKKKAQAYRSDIAYYLTYEEESDRPHLFAETKFMSRGKEITKEDYLSSTDPHYDEFTQELERLGLIEDGKITDEESIASILESNFSNLSSYCMLYLSDNIIPTLVRHGTSVSLRTNSGVDWFDVTFESDTLSMEEINRILKAYKKKKKYVRVGKSYFATDDEALQQALKDFAPIDDTITSERLPLYQALKLQSGHGLRVSIDEKLQGLFQGLLHYPSTHLNCDPAIKKSLRPYQKDGVKWLANLASHNLGGILADDMGLGKTLEVIAYLNHQKSALPSLIVAPKSLLFNWRNEFRKWDGSQPVSLVMGSKNERKKIVESMKENKGTVYVVSYDSLRADETLYEGIPFANVILDEAQYIANASAQKTKAVKTLKAEHRFALTGTPIQNSFMDLWSIMDFLLPGYLEGYREFAMIYNGYADNKAAEIEKLEREVAPFLLRRTKEEVLKDLPPKTEEVMIVSFEKAEQDLYVAYHKNAQISLQSAKEESRNKVAILAELTRLRQLCVDPSVFIENFKGISSKLIRTLEMVQEAIAGGHKVLIFSTFVSVLKHLQTILDDNEISNSLIYGDTPAKERLDLADEFNTSSDIKVMLISLKAGGTGLNLIGADIVIHLDPWWNVAAENQASDRAHRIGQTRPVSVFKLVAEGTIEEKIIELQEQKKGLTDIIRDADQTGGSLTEEDIRFLLS